MKTAPHKRQAPAEAAWVWTDGSVERLDQPERLSGEPLLPGVVLDLRSSW